MSFHRRVVSAFRPVAVQERKVSRVVVFSFSFTVNEQKARLGQRRERFL